MRSVDLGVTDGTVADARVAQVVECRWDTAECTGGGTEVGVALKALKADFRAGEHAWVTGAMGLMASGAAFHAHGSVFECEGTALIAVTFQAARFVGGDIAQSGVDEAAVGVVAIDAIDAALLEAVAVGFLELSHGSNVAGAAVGDVLFGLGLVNGVATGAGDLVPGVAAADGANAGRLVQMAG